MLNQISENVFWTPPESLTDRPVLGYVRGSRRNLLVDAGNSPAHIKWMYTLLREKDLPLPELVVLTHWHWDHVFGASTTAATVIAQHETMHKVQSMTLLDWRDKALDQRVEDGEEITFCRDCMKLELTNLERAKLQLKSPDIGFEDHILIDLGDVQCRVEHVGGDHSSDSTVIFVEPDGVLFVGDCLYPAVYDEPPTYTTERLFPLLDKITSYNAEWIIYAHSDEPVSRTDYAEIDRQLRTIGSLVDEHHGSCEAVTAALVDRGIDLADETVQERLEAFLSGYQAYKQD